MSLQTAITEWRDDYDQTSINTFNPAYTGSIRDINGVYHTGASKYQYNVKGYDFNWYAVQAVDHATPVIGGSKFLAESTTGFSWSATDVNANGLYEFTTYGTLNNLYLGYSPDNDHLPSPASATLTTLNYDYPLLVITGFNIAIDTVASSVFGVADGNSAMTISSTLAAILPHAQLYDSVTLNSAVLYSLVYDTTSTQAFEFVLDKYLESKGSDITASFDDIQTALAGTGVTISYYEEASEYATGGVITSTVAQSSLAESTSDLLQAA